MSFSFFVIFRFFVRGANKQGESPASNIVKIRLPRPGSQAKRKGSEGESEAIAKDIKVIPADDSSVKSAQTDHDDSESLSQSASESNEADVDVPGGKSETDTVPVKETCQEDVNSSAEEQLEGAAAKDVAREMSAEIIEAAIENALDNVQTDIEQINNSSNTNEVTQDSEKSAMIPAFENANDVSRSGVFPDKAVTGEAKIVCSETSGDGSLCEGVAVLPVGSSCGGGDALVENQDNFDNESKVQGVQCLSDHNVSPLQLNTNDVQYESETPSYDITPPAAADKASSAIDDVADANTEDKIPSEEESGWTFLSKPDLTSKNSDFEEDAATIPPRATQSAPATPRPFPVTDKDGHVVNPIVKNPFEGAGDILKALDVEKQQQDKVTPSSPERYPSMVHTPGDKSGGAATAAAVVPPVAAPKIISEQKKPVVEKHPTKSKPRIGKLAANFFGKHSNKAAKQTQKAEDSKSSRKQLRDAPYSKDIKSKKNKDKMSKHASSGSLGGKKGKSASLEKTSTLKSFSASTESAPAPLERKASIGPIGEEKKSNSAEVAKTDSTSRPAGTASEQSRQSDSQQSGNEKPSNVQTDANANLANKTAPMMTDDTCDNLSIGETLGQESTSTNDSTTEAMESSQHNVSKNNHKEENLASNSNNDPSQANGKSRLPKKQRGIPEPKAKAALIRKSPPGNGGGNGSKADQVRVQTIYNIRMGMAV